MDNYDNYVKDKLSYAETRAQVFCCFDTLDKTQDVHEALAMLWLLQSAIASIARYRVAELMQHELDKEE